jgi:hypothetical protein
MDFEGNVKQDKKSSLWLIEVEAFNLMTQGNTKEDAIFMLKDAVMELMHDAFPEDVMKDISLEVHFYSEKTFGIKSNNSKLLIAFALRRQREQAGISIRELAHKLKVKSPNAYAQYEQGKINISIDLLDRFLYAINPNRHSLLRFV